MGQYQPSGTGMYFSISITVRVCQWQPLKLAMTITLRAFSMCVWLSASDYCYLTAALPNYESVY